MDSREWEKGVCGVGVMLFLLKNTEGVKDWMRLCFLLKKELCSFAKYFSIKKKENDKKI